MAVDLQRTSYNMMIYEVRDFCTALIDTKGQLISQNVGGVSHFVADLGVIITDGMQRYGARGFAPGDVIITNHQAVAGQHLNNIVIYMPYFYRGLRRHGRRRRAQGREGPDPRQDHDPQGGHDHRPLGLLGRAQGRDQLAHARGRARRLQGADRAARSGQ
jgi:hypothetical protein